MNIMKDQLSYSFSNPHGSFNRWLPASFLLSQRSEKNGNWHAHINLQKKNGVYNAACEIHTYSSTWLFILCIDYESVFISLINNLLFCSTNKYM